MTPSEDELSVIQDQTIFVAGVIVQAYEDFRDGIEHFDPNAIKSAGSRGFLTLIGLDPDEIDELADEIVDDPREDEDSE